MTLTEKKHPGCFIVSESAGPFHTREAVTIALSQAINVGMILARNAVAAGVTASASADAGNTSGSGAITLDVTTPVLEGVKNGNYRAVCIEPATDGGKFAVFDPEGAEIGQVAVGATFAKEIKFVIADATDFVAGDAFTIKVGIEQADYNYQALDLSDAGEASKAAGIAIYGVTTDDTTKQKITAIVRGPCEVRLSDLEFPSGATAAQQAQTIRELDALGIVCR